MAVNYLSFHKLALEISSDVVYAAHRTAEARGKGKQTARGTVTKGLREGLVVIDAGFHGAALNAQPSLSRAVPLQFVDPDQLV